MTDSGPVGGLKPVSGTPGQQNPTKEYVEIKEEEMSCPALPVSVSALVTDAVPPISGSVFAAVWFHVLEDLSCRVSTLLGLIGTAVPAVEGSACRAAALSLAFR